MISGPLGGMRDDRCMHVFFAVVCTIAVVGSDRLEQPPSAPYYTWMLELFCRNLPRMY